jgi:hypothetical protein
MPGSRNAGQIKPGIIFIFMGLTDFLEHLKQGSAYCSPLGELGTLPDLGNEIVIEMQLHSLIYILSVAAFVL